MFRYIYPVVFALCTALTSQTWAHDHPAYSHDSVKKTLHPYWMKDIKDNVKLNELSLPGTHDSMSLYGGNIAQTQSMSLEDQLNSGIRALDIRCRHIEDVFAIHHGPIFQKTFFGDVMNTAAEFLKHNPSETIYMRVKEEHRAEKTTRPFYQTFLSYRDKYKDIIWQPTSNNPTVGETRGKVVILQNFNADRWYGINYRSLDIQDNYSVSSTWGLYDKWEAVKAQLAKANSDTSSDTTYMNYLSASGGAMPYFIASGHIAPATNSNRLLTGLTTPAFNDRWKDFPRVGCFIGMCSIAFEGTNTLTQERLGNDFQNKSGIIMADFPGPALINDIIKLNNGLK